MSVASTVGTTTAHGPRGGQRFDRRRPRIRIVGGGLAGLATAVGLVGLDAEVTVLESRPRLGGRAGSFPDPTTGRLVDNGQHVGMGCCTNLHDLCRRVGTDHLFHPIRRIRFLGPDGRLSYLEATSRLPAPLHLAWSFLKTTYLSTLEKLRIAYGLARLATPGRLDPKEPFGDWLRRMGQSPRTINLYWETVLVSALNETVDRMDVGHARKVMLDGFCRNRDGYRVDVPTVPLGEIFGDLIGKWLRDRGVDVRTSAGVDSVEFDGGGRAIGVRLRDGDHLEADHIVLAVPHPRVRTLLPASLAESWPELDRLEQLTTSPITGVHLWLSKPVCPFDHAVTPGRTIHWIFNRSAIEGGESGPDRPPEGAVDGEGEVQYLQIVVSASRDLAGLTNDEVSAQVIDDLKRLFPAMAEASVLHVRVVTEHGATFSARPGIEALRPSQATRWPGLWLAGDYTSTGWPATMEGAVRSGYKVAEAIGQRLDTTVSLVRPGLPTDWLARLVLGSGETALPIGHQIVDNQHEFGATDSVEANVG